AFPAPRIRGRSSASAVVRPSGRNRPSSRPAAAPAAPMKAAIFNRLMVIPAGCASSSRGRRESSAGASCASSWPAATLRSASHGRNPGTPPSDPSEASRGGRTCSMPTRSRGPRKGAAWSSTPRPPSRRRSGRAPRIGTLTTGSAARGRGPSRPRPAAWEPVPTCNRAWFGRSAARRARSSTRMRPPRGIRFSPPPSRASASLGTQEPNTGSAPRSFVAAAPLRRALHRRTPCRILPDVQCAVPFRFPVDRVVSHLRERPRRGGRRMAVRRIPQEAGATDTRRLTALFIALVFAHLLVVLVHTVAHLELQIVPPPTDTVFILGVILIGPVAALPILRFNRPLASGLLIVVMAAAFAYGSQSHFVIPGPDQVSIVPSNPWTVAFVVTAIGIGILELLAVVVAVSMFGRSLRNPSGSPAR